jgi:hypothetical protein
MTNVWTLFTSLAKASGKFDTKEQLSDHLEANVSTEPGQVQTQTHASTRMAPACKMQVNHQREEHGVRLRAAEKRPNT